MVAIVRRGSLLDSSTKLVTATIRVPPPGGFGGGSTANVQEFPFLFIATNPSSLLLKFTSGGSSFNVRGQMGPSVAEVKGADDQKLANGEDTNKGKNNHVESDSVSSKENVAGCCQGVNGVSCCRVGSPEENKETKKSKLCKNWPSLKERDVLTAVGVLGVVVAVTVAYKLYRRSS